LDRFSAIPFFAKYDDDLLRKLANFFTMVQTVRNQTIVDEGQPSDSLYIVKEGMVSIYKGSKLILNLTENQIFGEESILEDNVSLFTFKTG